MRILISDFILDHANTIKEAVLSNNPLLNIEDIYVKITSAESYSWIADLEYAVTNSFDVIINSTGLIAVETGGIGNSFDYIESKYPQIQFFLAAGNADYYYSSWLRDRSFVIVSYGVDQREGVYGEGLEFWDTYLPSNYSSFTNGVVAGKISYIKMYLNCDWWTARYLARLTADRNEPNRETEPWDLRNGYGKINVQAAIEAYGTEIPDDPYIFGEAGDSSFIVFADKITFSWDEVANAEGYKVYRKYRNEDEELIATTTELFHEDVPTRNPFPIQYRIEAYLNDETTEVFNREILFCVVGKVMVKGN